MNLDRYRQQHNDILANVAALRALVQAGIGDHAAQIAQRIVDMSTSIRFHLAAEDATLYPALRKASDPGVAELGRRYEEEMRGLGSAYGEFSRKWRVGATIAAAPEEFRREANAVFKALHERIQHENRELYPAAEGL